MTNQVTAHEGAIRSDLPDTHDLSLAELQASDHWAISPTLRRIASNLPSQQVPVAAFNSSI